MEMRSIPSLRRGLRGRWGDEHSLRRYVRQGVTDRRGGEEVPTVATQMHFKQAKKAEETRLEHQDGIKITVVLLQGLRNAKDAQKNSSVPTSLPHKQYFGTKPAGYPVSPAFPAVPERIVGGGGWAVRHRIHAVDQAEGRRRGPGDLRGVGREVPALRRALGQMRHAAEGADSWRSP